ncbi:acyltransferase [Aequorivita echinoideorum]|uniref:Acyltransferase n=1 Tax=Aequorivita echinoideorum TaxID=1549647 RepID=A0ABS5S781_9FLAO|nr:acyltransferase [Aequorivita echinoideorum]MBT0608838.1 acyltransferase [Aequorivita echinoideorum]
MIKKYFIKLLLACSKAKYAFLSNNKNISGSAKKHQPIICNGRGSICFGENVHFGVVNSPMFYNSYAYIEARTENSNIIFGNNIFINNNFSAISEKSISIGNNVLIGYNCNISDSFFHNLEIKKRIETDPNPQTVIIGNNVFIGNNVTILKGVNIGANCVIAAGSVVTKSFPENSIIAGIPASIIKTI